MNGKSGPSHSISGVFVFLLLGIFAVFSTVMVLLGARAYRTTADRVARHNAARLATAYVRSMVRSDDEENAVVVEELDGYPVITLRNEYDGELYLTRLYVHEGMLREWFTYAEAGFRPEYGEAVCSADELAAEIKDGILTVRVRSGSSWSNVDVALRSAAN